MNYAEMNAKLLSQSEIYKYTLARTHTRWPTPTLSLSLPLSLFHSLSVSHYLFCIRVFLKHLQCNNNILLSGSAYINNFPFHFMLG